MDAGSDADTSDDAGPGDDAGAIACDEDCDRTCAQAVANRSHLGCQHWLADLDNAALGVGRDASAVPLRVMLSNPGPGDADVLIRDVTGAAVNQRVVAAGTSATLMLASAEVDGSTPMGSNDGTHTAKTSNAFQVISDRPVAVHLLNGAPTAFSADGSLVLPAHALGRTYTVLTWPQTIADSSEPTQDFDASTNDEDLRTFLTLVSTAASATVTVTLGPNVVRVLGDGTLPEGSAGQTLNLTLAPFEVWNLETQGFGADFSGTRVEASADVAVFVGAETADVPTWDNVASRDCCGDHLETQLVADADLGRRYVIARTPSRADALNAAFGGSMPVPDIWQTEYVRVIAVSEGTTTVTTTLPAPDDRRTLARGELAEIEVSADFELTADAPVRVLHALPAQDRTGIPSTLPGGDPSLIALPATAHYRRRVAFATPELFAFDALTIVATTGAAVQLDGAPLPADCASTPLGAWTVHRCALSSPTGSGMAVQPGTQNDGHHVVSADMPLSVLASGFDAFSGYGFSGGYLLGPR